MSTKKPDRDDSRLRETSPYTRRRFLHWLGWGSTAMVGGGVALGTGAYITPRLNLEPMKAYSVGRPADYEIGEMRLIRDRQVFIFRTPFGFQAVSAICTHLGCSYQPFGRDDESFDAIHAHCPCHGSVFHRNGAVLKGPAPRSLPFYEMSLSSDGRLFVDETASDGSNWTGIDHRKYLAPTGEQIQGPVPEGEALDFT